MSEKRETMQQTLLVAFLLCLVCSILVAGVAVGLKDKQNLNRELDTKRSIVNIAGLEQPGMTDADIQTLFETRISAKLVDIQAGQFSQEHDAESFNGIKAAKDTSLSRALSTAEDIAKIRRLENYSTVYLVNDDHGNFETLILPVRGYGLWGTMYGFIAIAKDLNTVVGFGFYEHSETPGLGGEVDNPKWKATWPGKKVFADNTSDLVSLHVVKGYAGSDVNAVDGLAGATLTSNGVTNTIKFWLGKDAFGPFIDNLRKGGI